MNNKYIIYLLAVFFSWNAYGQITEGSIRYERRMNLFKKYPDKNTQKWIGEKNRYSYDHYMLYFNADKSVFIPDENDAPKEGMMVWLVQQHSAMQNLKDKQNVTLLNVIGQVIVVEDSLRPRMWKYTGKTRTILDYECPQVLLTLNDSVTLYAWFTPDIIPQVGPENFWGLPGAILGVASEDGGVTYFATEVVAKTVEWEKVTPKYSDKKATNFAALRERMINEFGKREEAKPLIDEFMIWQYY
jgi:GLPGLI family protein